MKFNHIFFAIITLSLLTLVACKENNKTNKSGEESATIVDTSAKAESEELTPEEVRQYTETGKKISKATFTSLSGNLKKALKEGGVKEAAEYCNIVALPLTDSLSTLHNATIKRTSFKVRNPENEATVAEFKMMQTYENKIRAGEELKPVVVPAGENTVQFYAPIMTQQLCLTCHGTIGEELTNENYSILKELYPEDKATGYKENDFRGMWSIELKKES